jgi:hypothetical protein
VHRTAAHWTAEGPNAFPAASAAARTDVIIDDLKRLLPIFYSFIIIGSSWYKEKIKLTLFN